MAHWQVGVSGGARRGLEGAKTPKMSLSTPAWNILVKNREVNCAKIPKFWSFMQSKPVNNVYKLPRLLGDFPGPHWGTRASPLDPTEGLPPPDPLGCSLFAKWKFPTPLLVGILPSRILVYWNLAVRRATNCFLAFSFSIFSFSIVFYFLVLVYHNRKI